MKKSYLIVATMLVIIILSVYGCKSTTTIIQLAPSSTYTPPTTTNVYTPPPITSTTIYYQPPATTIITTAPPNQIFNAQTWDEFPPGGIYVQAGQKLTLSWSADGGLVGYIFTTNQYNNWKNSLESVATYEGYQSGSQGSVTVAIQNSDTYCAVLYNNAISILGSGTSVKVYQAALTEH